MKIKLIFKQLIFKIIYFKQTNKVGFNTNLINLI